MDSVPEPEESKMLPGCTKHKGAMVMVGKCLT